MTGMNANTGRALDGVEHLCQSIGKVLTTPLFSRTQRRPVGSELPDLIDAPTNAATRLRLYAASATALMRWEPRLQLQRVTISAADMAGNVTLDIEGISRISGDFVSTSVRLNNGSAA